MGRVQCPVGGEATPLIALRSSAALSSLSRLSGVGGRGEEVRYGWYRGVAGALKIMNGSITQT